MEKTTKIRESQILQKVNPYSIPTVTLIYSVSPELPEQQSAINNYYLSAHNSQKIWTELYNYLGVAEEAYSDFQGCGTFAFTNGYQFTLSFCYDDLSAMEGIEKELERILSDYRKKVVRESGYQHELVKVEANIYTKSDTNVATQQNTYQQWIVDYSNRIQSLKNIFNYSPIQYNYYDLLVNLADGGDGYVTVRDMTKPKEDDAAAKMPSDPKKMALIGGAAGLVAGIAILLLIMLFAGRLQKAEELSDLFNLSLVGTLLGEGFQLPFEKLVKFFRTRRYGVFNVEKRIKHTALKIKAMCDDKNLKEIVISGTAASKRNKGLLEKLSKELNESGIKVSAIGNILTNSAAFDQAIKTKAVIFAEKEISSAYKNIEREILQVSGCDITLLGAICIY